MNAHYAGWRDDDLLELRLSDLRVNLRGAPLARCINRLYGELAARGLRFRPHVWLSDEWFTPDGVPGIAIPFYLADRRLKLLEQRQMLEVEGGSEAECMKILRHEAGHAIDNAYRLRRRRAWRALFGPAGRPYPKYYEPDPASRDYVHHLDDWYAQSHPAEDFAETFAVWLRPRSGWRRRYAGWPALAKLEYVDSLMQQLAGCRPDVLSRERVNPLGSVRKTLRQHYRARRAHYGVEQAELMPGLMLTDLRRLFSDHDESPRGRAASAFIESRRKRVREAVARWTRHPQYSIDQILDDLVAACRKHRLRVTRPVATLERELTAMVTAELVHMMHGGRLRVPL